MGCSRVLVLVSRRTGSALPPAPPVRLQPTLVPTLQSSGNLTVGGGARFRRELKSSKEPLSDVCLAQSTLVACSADALNNCGDLGLSGLAGAEDGCTWIPTRPVPDDAAAACRAGSEPSSTSSANIVWLLLVRTSAQSSATPVSPVSGNDDCPPFAVPARTGIRSRTRCICASRPIVRQSENRYHIFAHAGLAATSKQAWEARPFYVPLA